MSGLVQVRATPCHPTDVYCSCARSEVSESILLRMFRRNECVLEPLSVVWKRRATQGYVPEVCNLQHHGVIRRNICLTRWSSRIT